jgi:hypothetical protein
VDELPSVDACASSARCASGIAVEVERAAMRAIDLLEQQGALSGCRPRMGAGAPIVRYQRRDQHDVITLQLPGPRVRDGITIVAKERAPMQAPARSRPGPAARAARRSRSRSPIRAPALRAPGSAKQLDQAGRELLGSEPCATSRAGTRIRLPRTWRRSTLRSRKTCSSTMAISSIAPTPSARLARAGARTVGSRSLVLVAGDRQ